eukprot:2303282-Amphidinium_carterae.1
MSSKDLGQQNNTSGLLKGSKCLTLSPDYHIQIMFVEYFKIQLSCEALERSPSFEGPLPSIAIVGNCLND